MLTLNQVTKALFPILCNILLPNLTMQKKDKYAKKNIYTKILIKIKEKS